MKFLNKNLDIYLPVYEIESIISYQSVRKPTAFEGLILNLILEAEPQLTQQPLLAIAEKLKISPFIIEHTIQNLLDNEMLEHMSGDVLTKRASELSATALGREMYYKQEMPGKTKKESIGSHFNPLSQTLVKREKNWMTSLKDKTKALPERLFPINIKAIEDLTQEYLNQADEKLLPWKTVKTNISNIAVQVETTKWQAIKGQMGIDGNGNLAIEISNSENGAKLQQWLDTADSELVWNSILAPHFPLDSEELGDINWQTVEDVALLGDNITVTKPKLIVYHDESAFPNANNLQIVLAETDEVTLKGHLLTIPTHSNFKAKFSPPETINFLDNLFNPQKPSEKVIKAFDKLYVDTNNQASIVKEGNTTIYFAKQSHQIGLNIKQKDSYYWEKLKDHLISLGRRDENNAIPILAFAGSFLTEDIIISELPELTMGAFLNFNKLLKKFSGKPIRLDTDLMQRIGKLSSIKELQEFKEIFGKQVIMEENWLSVSLKEVLIKEGLMNAKLYNTSFDDDLKPFSEVNSKLTKQLNLEKIKKSLVINILPTDSLNLTSIQLVESWLRLFKDITNKFSVLSKVEEFTEQFKLLSSLQTQIQHNFAPVQADNRKVAVFDTSYVMRYSDTLKALAENSNIVIPRIVIDELDALKIDDNGNSEKAKQARQASRIIGEISNEKVFIEPSHENLRSYIKDNGKDLSNDELILTVALYHRLNDVTFYCADNNLNLKAKSIHIPTQSKPVA